MSTSKGRAMKKILSTTIAVALGAGNLLATGFESRQFIPYFNMRVDQGGYLPDKGAFFTGANMNMQAGLLAKVNDRHSFFGLYNLDFEGQAFQFPDTQEFDSKSQAHLFNLEYRWKIDDHWRVRPGIALGKTYTQTAAAEVWGHGLYDDKSVGYQLAGDYDFTLWRKKATATAMISRYTLKFPNYTDLLSQFRQESANTALAGGEKNQDLVEYGLSLQQAPWRVKLRFNNVDFTKEKIIQSNGTYGGDKQADSNVILSAAYDVKLWIFESSPELSYQIHHSNQNFLLFLSATDATPVYASNYYSYKETALNIPLFINLTEKWALSGGFLWRGRAYDKRSPLNESEVFKSGRQRDDMEVLSAGLRKRMNEVSALFLTYSLTRATSNNKFERYLPSNYTGQGISVGYQLTY